MRNKSGIANISAKVALRIFLWNLFRRGFIDVSTKQRFLKLLMFPPKKLRSKKVFVRNNFTVTFEFEVEIWKWGYIEFWFSSISFVTRNDFGKEIQVSFNSAFSEIKLCKNWSYVFWSAVGLYLDWMIFSPRHCKTSFVFTKKYVKTCLLNDP